jgi:hypothetical protein
MFAIPLGPKVADRLALEDGNKDIDEAKGAGKSDGTPESLSYNWSREDAKIEEEQRQLKERHKCKVESRHSMEEHAKFCDLIRC